MATNTSESESLSFRFSLKGLLLAVAAIGVFLTPVHWFGLAYFISACLTAGLVIACIFAQRGKSPWLALGVAVIGAVVGFPLAIGALIYLFHALLNLALCFLLLLLRVRPKVFAICTAGLAVGVYGYVMWDAAATVRELLALKELHPLVSLNKRLAFEQDAHATATVSATPISLAPTVAAKLDEQDSEFGPPRYFRRSWALQELHEHIYRQFAHAAGFGVIRMASIYPQMVELAPRKRIELPISVAISRSVPPGMEFSSLHRIALWDLLDADRMGYVRDRNAVAGFDAHGFSTLADALDEKDKDAVKWKVPRLELVGLLRHDEPQVYVAQTLPFMDQLADIPRRALNEFEARALPQLHSSEDIVVDEKPDQISMLGAVRAGTSCLACHEGERGRLLGAFSYSIEPVVGAESKASDSADDATPGS